MHVCPSSRLQWTYKSITRMTACAWHLQLSELIFGQMPCLNSYSRFCAKLIFYCLDLSAFFLKCCSIPIACFCCMIRKYESNEKTEEQCASISEVLPSVFLFLISQMCSPKVFQKWMDGWYLFCQETPHLVEYLHFLHQEDV